MFISIMGDKVVQEKFRRMGDRAVNAKPAMAEIVFRLFAIEAQIFESQGRRGGGSWAQITPEWWFRKYHGGYDTRILHMTHLLRNSMTKPGAEGQILHYDHRSATLGSALPYAARQNVDRPFDQLTETDRLELRAIIARHLMKVWGVEVL